MNQEQLDQFTFVVRGLAEILPRVARAHEQWIVSKGCVFRPAGNTSTHNHLIKFFWEMLPKGGGPVEARGLDVFVLTPGRQIQALYQFSDIYSLTISSPPQVFYLNRQQSFVLGTNLLNYTKTIDMNGGATITLTADPVDDIELQNKAPGSRVPLVVPGISPAPQAFDGQFIQMDLVSLTQR